MSNEKLGIIEKRLKEKNIKQYELYLIEKNIFETIFIKDNPETDREVEDFEYFIRILSQKGDQTGIGVIKGNSLNPNEIGRNIENCVLISKNNTISRYWFPEEKTLPNVKTADDIILKDPVGIKNDLCEEFISNVRDQKDVVPTFSRIRLHINHRFLKNSNGVNLDSLKSFFYLEYSLKAQKNGKLSEYWNTEYIKEKGHLNFETRVKNWAKLAKDALIAEPPIPNNKAIVIFPPHVLREAINHVIGFHASGQAFSEKISAFNIGDKVASEDITLIDDGLLEGGLGSGSWDGEGNPHQRTKVIKSGVFQNRLFDQKYGIINETESTGNGIRTLTGTVNNGISNIKILPGNMSLDNIVSEIKEGYYIEKFSWLNPQFLSGFFGSEIRNGYYIKNGEYQNPIKLGTVSGNILDMIKNCLYISKETEFTENSLLPYIVFSNLTISF